MTENRRIVLNICATYGRSLFALVCAFVTGRWVFLSLGEVDYGLYGLVAGLTAFIGFFNGILGSAIARFYAVSVGAARTASDKESALRECQAWFNTAVSVHAIIPVILMVAGYPIGCWAIEHFLTIPADRIHDCIWVFRFVCLTCFLGMVSVPFNAMYTAKQYIAELTIYSFVTTGINVIFLYYMITHPGIWLVRYGLWTCTLSFVPSLIILARAMIVFPECTLQWSMMFDFSRFRRVMAFSFWQCIGSASYLLRTQGMSVVINRFFGPSANAAMSVGSSINGHANTLSGSMMGALSPAIVNAYGAGDMDRMRKLAFIMCRFAVLLSMIFAVPLILEMPKILNLWLKHPPQYASIFAILFLMQLILENMTVGHMIAINATGRIAVYQVVMGVVSLTALPIAWMWMCFGGRPYVSVLSIIITIAMYSVIRLWFARKLVGLSIHLWIRKVGLPLLLALVLSAGFGSLPALMLEASFIRICVTTIVCELVLLPLTWFVVLSAEERRYVAARMQKLHCFVRLGVR